MASDPITFMANRWGNNGNNERLFFCEGPGSKITADGDCSHEIKKCLLLGRKVMANLDSILKSRDITWPTKVYLIKAMGFPVVMCRHESSTIKKAEHWIIDIFKLVLEKTLENPFDCKETKLADPKGNQPWILIGRTDAEAEAPILWPPDVKSRFIGKDTDSWKDWKQEEMSGTEDEMVIQHHWLNEHEFEQTPDAGGQRSLVCYSPWGG